MAEQLLAPWSKFVVPSTTVVIATGNSGAITLPLADSYTIIQDVTVAAGTTETLDTAIQITPDGGTTWYSVMRFAQVTTAANQQRITFQPLQGRGEASSQAALAATGGQVTANQPLSTQIRFLYTISGTSPSYTLGIAVFAQARATAV
jgi:hypothetical protein